ncbi:MAG: sugar transferase [Candidatus Amesbacteria bacterium]|nr:sugar transferase [Candidatus Amesbacteria bacterium]
MQYSDLKRLMDMFYAIVLGIVFGPICIVTAIAIKLETPDGPIFADIPKRVGKDGKLFTIYKFRSMIPDAHILLKTDPQFKKLYEEYKKSSFKLYDDPRVTGVGKIIRKFSIDEVPQIFNIFRGEMSLIGPRPYFADELEDQQKKYPHTKQLVKMALSVRPGITGQWQVSGRSEINFDKRIDMDAHYAENMNLWYDLKILLKTPFVMLSGKGAV